MILEIGIFSELKIWFSFHLSQLLMESVNEKTFSRRSRQQRNKWNLIFEISLKNNDILRIRNVTSQWTEWILWRYHVNTHFSKKVSIKFFTSVEILVTILDLLSVDERCCCWRRGSRWASISTGVTREGSVDTSKGIRVSLLRLRAETVCSCRFPKALTNQYF